jgi:chromosome segregation ATPase
MDVTPKEEVLQNELDRLKEAFDKCTTQLDSCRLENDLLKGFKINLEQETQQLKEALQEAQSQIDIKANEWEELNEWTSQRIKSYQQTIREQEQNKAQLEEEKGVWMEKNATVTKRMVEMEKRYQSSLVKLEKEKHTLQQRLVTLQSENQQQKDTITRFYQDLEASRGKEQQLQKELSTTQGLLQKHELEIQQSKKVTGTIATLAQSLKAEKVTLERSLATTKASLELYHHREMERTEQLTVLREQYHQLDFSSSERVHELETMLDRQTTQYAETKQDLENVTVLYETTLSQLEETNSQNLALKQHLEGMEVGRHGWLDQKIELEESLEEAFQDVENANIRLRELEGQLEQTECQRALLEAQLDTYRHAADREEALLLQMEEQKVAFEERLNEIRGILGLKFTVAIQTGLQHKLRNVDMPTSFRVPLLAQKMV